MDDGKIATEMTLDGIARQLEEIQTTVAAMKTDMTGMKTDMTGMKTDMAGMKTDMAGMKTDMAGMKTDMAGMKTDMAGMKTDMAGMKTDISGIKAEMKTGFNDARVRDEELRSLMTFGLEAREALRESVEARFDATDQKHDEEINLLKDVLRAVNR